MCKRGDLTEVMIDSKSISIDSCIADAVHFWNTFRDIRFRTLGSCCGHGEYPATIVVKQMENVYPVTVISRGRSPIRAGRIFVISPNNKDSKLRIYGITISRKRRFYKRDDEGHYFIPEIP